MKEYFFNDNSSGTTTATNHNNCILSVTLIGITVFQVLFSTLELFYIIQSSQQRRNKLYYPPIFRWRNNIELVSPVCGKVGFQ
jgi:hypothetical protein